VETFIKLSNNLMSNIQLAPWNIYEGTKIDLLAGPANHGYLHVEEVLYDIYIAFNTYLKVTI
jgi:hypothetical protein